MLLCLTLCLVSWAMSTHNAVATQVYDTFTGKIISQEQLKDHIRRNTTFWCTQSVEPCSLHEGRRMDGSCNNVRQPSRGTSHTPSRNVLPLVFHKNWEPRRDKRGAELPLSRKVRTTLLAQGRAPDRCFTHLLTYFAVFMSADILSFHDTINYLTWTTYCCEEKGKTDPQCISQAIPDDDPVHRFTNERCFNLTRPWTFQSKGCVRNNTTPERITTATTFFDLSQLYGLGEQNLLTKRRLFKNGLLKYEVDEGRIWPPSFHTSRAKWICVLNQEPREKRCHDIGEESSNGILGTSLFTIWMWRHHNHVAATLASINPCWSDEQLFYTARDINIAVVNQIFYYELNPLLLGEENLYAEEILSPNSGYRDIYDENILPKVSTEYSFVLRWTHTIQEVIVKMYDTKGNYLKSTSISNLTLRTGYLSDQNHIDYLTQGAFRQATGKIDSIIDPNIAETGLGPLQRISDLATSDLAKNRYFGLAPYSEYRKHCFGEIISSFDDLLQAIDPEKIELLKELYVDVEDVDLLAGIWIERPIPGAQVPATFYCLVVDQLRRSIVSDRHWYERQNRPNSFSIGQLLEIRKASIARLMCDVGDKVTSIQPQAFLVPGPGNELCDCGDIAKINLEAWRDHQCY